MTVIFAMMRIGQQRPVKIVSSMLAGRIFGIKTLVLVQITASNSERKQYVDGWPCDPVNIFKAVGINYVMVC